MSETLPRPARVRVTTAQKDLPVDAVLAVIAWTEEGLPIVLDLAGGQQTLAAGDYADAESV